MQDEQAASPAPRWRSLLHRAAALRVSAVTLGFGAAVSLAFIAFVVQPFRTASVEEKEVAEQWAEVIGRLGMIPVYPPREDIYVGDVQAYLDVHDAPPGPDKLLGNTLLLGHIDLRDQIALVEARRPAFADDAPAAKPAGDGPDPVRLSVVAFPGVTVTKERHAQSSFLSDWLGWNAGSDDSGQEAISIPEAYTYGIYPLDAFQAFVRFCGQPANKDNFCQGARLRHLMSLNGYRLAEAKAPDGGFLYPISLRIVTVLYMTKTIDQHYGLTNGQTLAAQSAAEPAAEGHDQAAPGDASAPAQAGGETPPAPNSIAPAPSQQGNTPKRAAKLSVVRSSGMEVVLRHSYQQPLVFGYRTLSIDLGGTTPAKPKVTGK